MAKQVSQEKLDKIAARGEKRRAKKETRQTNRTKKLAARQGITEEQAADIKANRKQRRLEKFQTAIGTRQGVTTAKIDLQSARKKMQENKVNTMQETTPPSDTVGNMFSQMDATKTNEKGPVIQMKASPLTKRTSCKY